MINLGSWMNKVLTGWGVDEKIANTFDEAIIAILLVAGRGRYRIRLFMPSYFCRRGT